ncbi:maleylpyruvate isomerase family mycothiol-dependent enzyme [Ilumatobacter sp.]|uniref:maleylpyruvate isomerase family mycothiol-dependent enzyme n=1 Tax=Ilumatobacter sp. TaxID=1967498 RepID=UPI003C573638
MTITTTPTPADIDRNAPHSASLSGYIAAVESEGRRFARAAAMSELDLAVPPCPGWVMRDLVRHLGEIHLWAAANIVAPKPSWLQVDQLGDLQQYWPDLAAAWPSDAELIPWYRATNATLVDVLQSAPLDVQAFTFLPAPTPLTMWARRQASEIAIHRFDAESTQRIVSHFDAGFAADMLDELITGFAPHYRSDAVTAVRILQVVAADVDEQWWVTIGPDGITTARTGGQPDLTVTGSAAELYLLLWNRTHDSTVQLDGDTRLMDAWRHLCQVVWSGG